MIKKLFLVQFLMVLLPCALLAQKLVTGIVRDVNGPLTAASVTEKGHTVNGTSTDENGRFKITLRNSNTIVVSAVGYQEQEVDVKGRDNVQVTMQVAYGSLNETVVVAYGKKNVSLIPAQ